MQEKAAREKRKVFVFELKKIPDDKSLTSVSVGVVVAGSFVIMRCVRFALTVTVKVKNFSLMVTMMRVSEERVKPMKTTNERNGQNE